MAERPGRKLPIFDHRLHYNYKGGIFSSALTPPESWAENDAFQSRPTDICVASASRSGILDFCFLL